MPEWLSIALGIVGGSAVIAGAVYLAFRPYLAVEPPKAWMPEATRQDPAGMGGGPTGGDGLHS